MKLTFGSDPELHMADETGRIVSSLRVLNCDKTKPIILGEGMRMYADNVLTEMAFPPSDSSDEMIQRLHDVFKRAFARLAGYDLISKAAHVYPNEELATDKAWEVGCNPNFDAWSQDVNLPADFKNGTRTSSFHIHIGNPSLTTIQEKIAAIKLLDIYLGCASVVFDHDPTSVARRNLYGKAGEFRSTSYGIEYRVLGPYVLRHQSLVKLSLDLVEHAMERVPDHKKILEEFDPIYVQAVINTGDRDGARMVMNRTDLPASILERVEANVSAKSIKEAWL